MMITSLLTWTLLLGARGTEPQALADASTPAERLLPPGSLMLFATDDVQAGAEQSKSMPLAKILEEPEVKAFLKQPREMVEKLFKEGLGKLKSEQGIDLDINRILNTNYRRLFVALTHVVIEEGNTDIGLVIGIEPIADTMDVLSIGSDLLKQHLEKAADDAKRGKVSEETYAGVSLRRFKSNEKDAPTVLFARKDGLSLVAFSERLMKGILDRMQVPAKESLATDPEFSLVFGKLGARPKGAAYTYFNPTAFFDAILVPVKKGISDQGKADWLPKVDSLYVQTGLSGIKAIGGLSYSENGVAVARGFVHTASELQGLASLMSDSHTIDKSRLAWIPKAAQSFSFGSFQLGKLYDMAMAMAEIVQPGMKTQAEQMAQGMIQQLSGAQAGAQGGDAYDLRRDLLGSFAGDYVMYQTQSQGFGSSSDVVLIAKVTNEDKVRRGLELLMKVPSLFEMSAAAKEMDVDGTKITMLDLSQALGPIAMVAGAIQPCFAFKNGNLVFGLSTGGVKGALARFDKSPDSITEADDFAKAYARLPAGKEPVALSYNNVKGGFETMYNGLVTITMLPGISDSLHDLPIDLALLPTADAITRHLFGSVSASYADQDGISTASFSPFGGEAALAGVVAAAGIGVAAYGMEQKKLAQASATASAPGGEGGNQAAQVEADLGLLRAAITVYKLDHDDKLPATLEELLKPTDNYPNGYLGGRQDLPKDPWGHAFVYVPSGRSYKLRSVGANGVDDNGAGDDVTGR
ncbi:MAG: type II secretion system protein GspG [Planctomycetota bacterium]